MVRPSAVNRRKDRRIRVDRAVRVPVQLFPILPFVGTPCEAVLVNLSAGGMGLLLENDGEGLAKGTKLVVHFRLPGLPLTECRGTVSNHIAGKKSAWIRIGVKFQKAPVNLTERIQKMINDDAVCDARMFESADPRCDTACSFHSLCHKPIRVGGHTQHAQFEISLQRGG